MGRTEPCCEDKLLIVLMAFLPTKPSSTLVLARNSILEKMAYFFSSASSFSMADFGWNIA